MNNRTILFSLLLLGNTAWSQSYQKTDNGIRAKIQGIDVEVQFYTPQIVRIIKLPSGSATREKSLAVIATPQKLQLAVADQKDELMVSSQVLQVKLNRQTATVRFYAPQGNLLLQEAESGTHFSP